MNADLFERFRSGSLERIRNAKRTVADLEETGTDIPSLQRVLGELHTLKGESRMLGLAIVSQIAHAVEECLAPALHDTLVSRETAAACREALDSIARSLKGEPGGDPTVLATVLEGLNARAGAAHASGNPGDPGALPSDVAALATPPPGPPQPQTQSTPVAQEKWAQVRTSQVDRVCEQVHELTVQFGQLHAQMRSAWQPNSAIGRTLLDNFDRCQARLQELAGSAWALRLVPLEPAFAELAEHARDLALVLQKRVRVRVDAGGAQVERGILDELWEPLLHLVRNAVDHGIEDFGARDGKVDQAEVVISARTDGPNVLVTVADDGRGIDLSNVRASAVRRGVLSSAAASLLSDAETLDLLFSHGFSTREQVTDVSGRGVGLDVVRRKIESVGGKVTLASERGVGTSFTLAVPITITRERVLVFTLGDALFGVPSRSAFVVVALDPSHIGDVTGGRVFKHAGTTYPLQSLALTLGYPDEDEEKHAIVLELFGEKRAYTLADLRGEHDVVRRPADPLLAEMGMIGASATLEDGRLVLLIRPAALVGRARLQKTVRREIAPRRKRRVLIVDDSPIVRELLTEMLTSAGLAVEAAEDGMAAWKVLEGAEPDLVLSDVEMPRMGGLELLKRIRGKTQKLPVIMLTTRGSAEDRKAAAELGADAYLVKSDFEGSKLMDTVSRFINLQP